VARTFSAIISTGSRLRIVNGANLFWFRCYRRAKLNDGRVEVTIYGLQSNTVKPERLAARFQQEIQPYLSDDQLQTVIRSAFNQRSSPTQEIGFPRSRGSEPACRAT
jgi:hypothetical protein